MKYCKYKKGNYPISENGLCPKCGWDYSECLIGNDGEYIIGDEVYPKVYDAKAVSNANGNFYYWKEFHHCPKCGKEFIAEQSN